MKTSVIIPTYNGAHKILNILSALERQHYHAFEVIVVIDGSTDNTADLLARKKFKLPVLRVIQQENGGRSVSRNRGAREAEGNLLIFFDDDMRPEPDCIGQHVKHQLTIPDSIMVGGHMEEWEMMQTDFQKYKAFLSRQWSATIEGKARPLLKEELFLSAANFSISKDCFYKLGGFDERLTDAEDFDLGVQAFMKKIPIYYRVAANAWHDDFVTCRSMIIRQRQYRKAHALLKKLKPDLYKAFNQYQPVPIDSFRYGIYWLFSSRHWIKVIDQHQWLRLLPQKVRFKIYDFTITSLSVHFPEKKFEDF